MPYSSFIAFRVTSVILIRTYFNALAIGRFTSISSLSTPTWTSQLSDWHLYFPQSPIRNTAPPRPTIREKLHPFLATIPPSARFSRWLIFNSPLRGQTTCATGFLAHSSPPSPPAWHLLSLPSLLSFSLTAALPVILPRYFSPPLTVTL